MIGMSKNTLVRIKEKCVVWRAFYINGFPISMGNDHVYRIGLFKGHYDFHALREALGIKDPADFYPNRETRLENIFVAPNVVEANAYPSGVKPLMADNTRFSMHNDIRFFLLIDSQNKA